jgi:hypothetical protein
MTNADKICRINGGQGKKHRQRRVVFRYDLADLFRSEAIKLRYVKVSIVGNNLESWVRLAQEDNIMVIFYGCTGRVIECSWKKDVEADDNLGGGAVSCSCSSSCWDQQETKGVLGCLLQDLRAFSTTDWETASNILTIRPGIMWTATGTGPHLFGHNQTPSPADAPCACCGKLDRLQSVEKRRSSSRMARLVTWAARQAGVNVGNPGCPDWFDRPYAVRFGSAVRR